MIKIDEVALRDMAEAMSAAGLPYVFGFGGIVSDINPAIEKGLKTYFARLEADGLAYAFKDRLRKDGGTAFVVKERNKP